MSITPFAWSEGRLRLLDQTRLPHEANPAFDIIPHRLITAIVTERGIAQPPYVDSLRELMERVAARA